jgi:hypothetical protein
MRLRVHGPLRLTGADGTDRTPRGVKERALLALVILSPGQARTRAWLQGKLWSDSDPARAAGSCRQALTTLRKALGPLADRLKTDRLSVRIDPMAEIEPFAGAAPDDLLSDLDVRDPEFDDWLREFRGSAAAAQLPQGRLAEVPRSTAAPDSRPLVLICPATRETGQRSQFLLRSLLQRIEGELILTGDVEVRRISPAERGAEAQGAAAIIDVEPHEEPDAWYLLLRVHGAQGRRCVWTGRMRLPPRLSAVWDAPEMTRLVNQAVGAVADLIAGSGRLTPWSAIQRAVRRVYEFDKTGLSSADALLKGAQDSDLSGLALAWRGFLRLTSALEFRAAEADLAAEAEDFCRDALARASRHPVVLGLATQVHLKLTGDTDFGHYLALRAAEASDSNPYALDAMAQALLSQGDFQAGHELALAARDAADGLPQAFSYEMQCCLTALSVGLTDAALAHALASHRRMPLFRPALRYLVALNLLAGRRDEAAVYTDKLRRLEPDFRPSLLCTPGYPVETLRNLGLAAQLQALV